MKTPANPTYTRYHPRWYRRRMPIFWWLRKAAYTGFILRELTSLAVGYSALLLMAKVAVLARGPGAYGAFVQWLAHPAVATFHTLVLMGLLFHTVTWLNLAPKALVLRARGRRVPDMAIALAHYGAWIVASGAILWLLAGR